MKTKAFRIISILRLVVLIVVIGTLIAGAIAKANLAKQYPAPGQLVDVGGYKQHRQQFYELCLQIEGI
jgi:hypothetical protein